jgi:predicted DNA-binding transcriptional regulator AlpA
MHTRPEVTGRRFITTNQLRERWGCVSHMFIVRRIEADPAMPRPTKLGGRINFFDLDQIEAYERKRVRASAT